MLRARLQYLDAVIASGATDREVEVKIEPSEPDAAGKDGEMDVDQAEDKDEDKDKRWTSMSSPSHRRLAGLPVPLPRKSFCCLHP